MAKESYLMLVLTHFGTKHYCLLLNAEYVINCKSVWFILKKSIQRGRILTAQTAAQTAKSVEYKRYRNCTTIFLYRFLRSFTAK